MKLKETIKGNYKLTLTPYELQVLASLCSVVKLDGSESAKVALQLMEAYDYHTHNDNFAYFDVTGTIGEFDQDSLSVTIHD